ncbi:MAG: hypothetical protein LHV68_09905 [Elusimicrobia bacterium]|nr:hypothetical protein [Candidatus Liberimonas magnetica]
MNEVNKWYATLMLSVHCLCEQGYNPERIIDIAKLLEQKTGIKADSVIREIQRTIDFHIDYEKHEIKNRKSREREVKQQEKHEQKFNELPADIQHMMIMENSGSYHKAVDVLAKKGRKYAMSFAEKLNKNHKEFNHVQPENQRGINTEALQNCPAEEQAHD